MNKYIAYLLLCSALVLSSDGVFAKSGSKKKKGKVEAASTPAKKVSEYEKLFKDKKSVTTKKGLLTLHLVDGQLLVEYPLNMLNKDMMILSVVSEISDHTDSYVGGSPMRPIHVKFTKIGNSVQLRRDRTMSQVENDDPSIKDAINKSNLNSILRSFDIKAYSPDSSAVVFDMTEYFTGDDPSLNAIDVRGESKLAMMGVSYRHSKDKSFMEDIFAFDDNVSFKSYLTYDVSFKSFFRKTTSARMTRTLVLLPEQPMKKRLSDYRIPVTVSGKYNYSQSYELMKPVYYMHRWRVEPKDQAAFDRGEMVEPIKPIVFYMDTTLTDIMQTAIKTALLRWNEGFEKIGFKNVIQVKMFPKDDPNFDPENFKYNTIRYVPSLAGKIGVKTHVDPRTGEILRASILMCHNYVYEVPFQAILYTGHSDPTSRTRHLPEDKLLEYMTNDLTFTTGISCFGMKYNLAPSAAYSVDSLRSATFTQKYGTTPSMLDRALYNFVAPIDGATKGIKLTPVGIGEYDCHVMKCIYKPIVAKNEKEELAVIEGWINEHITDPRYRYENSKNCPDCGADDVGNNDFEVFKYGVENLKYTMANFDKWITDEEDPDYDFRDAMYEQIFRRYKQILTQVVITAYGIKTYERKVGDPFPSYIYTKKDVQLKAWDILYKEKYMPEWVLRRDIEQYRKPYDRINSHKDYFMLLTSITASSTFMYEGVEGSLGHSDYIKIMYNNFFEPTRQGKTLKNEDLYYQMKFFRTMVASSRMVDKKAKYKPQGGDDNKIAFAGDEYLNEPLVFDFNDPASCIQKIEEHPMMKEMMDDDIFLGDDVSANWGALKTWPVVNVQHTRHVYYQVLQDMRKLLKEKQFTGDRETQMHYKYMVDKLNTLMD